MTKLYVDENIGSRILLRGLQEAGYTAVYCRDFGYDRPPDDFHYHAAAQRGEVLVTSDADFVEMHGALTRLANDNGVANVHAGILVLPQRHLSPFDYVRLIDAFLAAELPIVNELYNYQPVGGWTRYRIAHTYP